MLKKAGSIFATILGLILLVYSASRSLDFISLTLPADKQVLAYFGVAALDGGILAWMSTYLKGSTGAYQRIIAMSMIVVDFIGAVAMFTMDTLYNTGKIGMTAVMTPEALQTAVIGLSLVIAINIGATLAHHLTDPDTMRDIATDNAQSMIEDEAIKLISEHASSLASEIAPSIASDWRAETSSRYISKLKNKPTPRVRVMAADTESLPDFTVHPAEKK